MNAPTCRGVRAGSGFASALVVVALFMPFVTVTSCGDHPEKTSTTGAQLIAGADDRTAPTASRPFLAVVALLAVGGVALASAGARWAAVARLAAAALGAVVTAATAVVFRVDALFASTVLGPGYWLALFGFALALTVETVDLVAARRAYGGSGAGHGGVLRRTQSCDSHQAKEERWV